MARRAEPPAGPALRSLSRAQRGLADRLGEPGLRALTWAASAAGMALIALLVYKVFDQAGESVSHFGLGFLTANVWDPVSRRFGAASFVYGTAVSSLLALVIAGPLSIAIALFLTELAPRRARRPVATLVELLAAIPSVVLGLWGIIVLAPFLVNTLEPALHSAFGWIPLFEGSTSPFGLLPAILILTIMVVPIIASVTREVFETVPGDLKESALALGATRWEMVRMVILPYAKSGIVGASILGLGRALGEAIAVTQVIGDATGVHASLFAPADTLASRVASTYQGATSTLEISSLAYLSAILLVLALIVNVIARLIVRRSTLRMRRAGPRPGLAVTTAEAEV
ncbi:MAG TPA: phosphate ABC transporter permease subunit PstC [Solirubrobacteraceae bacterium]|nr:phosphate ABC transporter permease subunit PstC [Solirubrobacteraceae bacterium]